MSSRGASKQASRSRVKVTKIDTSPSISLSPAACFSPLLDLSLSSLLLSLALVNFSIHFSNSLSIYLFATHHPSPIRSTAPRPRPVIDSFCYIPTNCIVIIHQAALHHHHPDETNATCSPRLVTDSRLHPPSFTTTASSLRRTIIVLPPCPLDYSTTT